MGLRKHHLNKARGGDKISAELFKILKTMLLKRCTHYVSKCGKSQWPQGWRRSVFIPIPKKGNAKEFSNYYTIVLISHSRKLILENPSR